MLQKYSIFAVCDVNDRGLKAQMKYADKIGAKYTIVLGDNELETKKAMIKNMKTGEKSKISLGEKFVEDFVILQTENQDDIKF